MTPTVGNHRHTNIQNKTLVHVWFDVHTTVRKIVLSKWHSTQNMAFSFSLQKSLPETPQLHNNACCQCTDWLGNLNFLQQAQTSGMISLSEMLYSCYAKNQHLSVKCCLSNQIKEPELTDVFVQSALFKRLETVPWKGVMLENRIKF